MPGVSLFVCLFVCLLATLCKKLSLLNGSSCQHAHLNQENHVLSALRYCFYNLPSVKILQH